MIMNEEVRRILVNLANANKVDAHMLAKVIRRENKNELLDMLNVLFNDGALSGDAMLTLVEYITGGETYNSYVSNSSEHDKSPYMWYNNSQQICD